MVGGQWPFSWPSLATGQEKAPATRSRKRSRSPARNCIPTRQPPLVKLVRQNSAQLG